MKENTMRGVETPPVNDVKTTWLRRSFNIVETSIKRLFNVMSYLGTEWWYVKNNVTK